MKKIITSTLFVMIASIAFGQAFRVAPSGKVGIGAYEPQQQLDVRGDIFSTGFFIPTDGRLSIVEDDFSYGLNEVLQLSPKVFRYNGDAGLKSEDTHVGVMAQSLMEVAPELVTNFSHVSDEGDSHYLKVDDSAIKYMLINAIQEQNKLIATLQKQVADLETKLGNNSIAVNEARNSEMLYQNAPNPYTDVTTISYYVDANAAQAEVNIYDLSGALLRSMPIETGKGQIEIEAGELAAGTYTYTLVVDSALVATKKMSIFR